MDDEYPIRLYSPNISKSSLRLRKQFILNRSKDFIQFLSECLVNLLRGDLRDLQKEDLVEYQKEVSELTQKRTPLHKRRIILSSSKCTIGIYHHPFCHQTIDIVWNIFFQFRTQFINHKVRF